MLDARTEKTLQQFTQELHQLLGDELIAVVLYGSAAGENFIPGTSDLNVAIVVAELRFETLRALQPHITNWHKRGFALPLLLDREFLQRGHDVFPMEFYDLLEQHRVLWGEEVLTSLAVDPHHLRFQAEYEARSKLLRLQALYLECAGDRKRLQVLMLDSLKTFLILMRNLLRMAGANGLLTHADVLQRCEQHFQCEFPRMHNLMAIREGTQRWPHQSNTDFFRDYLTEVRHLVGLIDRFVVNASLS
jgi:predicted nucleotidyltransferase